MAQYVIPGLQFCFEKRVRIYPGTFKHNTHVIEYVKKWIKIQRTGVEDEMVEETLRELTKGYVATTDTPMIQFTEELVRLYPDAVVICTTRERSAWYKSSQALNKNTGLWWLDYVFFPMPTLRWFGLWRDTIGDR
jgi:hypothetical protein